MSPASDPAGGVIDSVEHEFLRHVWFPVARLGDIGERPVAANILGHDLVVYRVGEDVTVADGRCPHRGMALWLGGVRDGGLECPYHGWRFDGGGRCVDIPSLPPDVAPPPVTLPTYPSRRAYGHVWASLAEPYLPLPDMPTDGEPGWTYGYGDPIDVRCGMRQLTENFRDMAHFPFVHTGTMGPNVRRVVDPYRVERDGWRLHWTLATDLGGTALDANPGLANGQTLTYSIGLPMFASVRTRFDDGGGRMVAQMATPIAADGTRVRQFWIVGIDEVVATRHGVGIDEMWEYERQIFAEDHPIVTNQWPPEAPLDVHGQVHTRADRFSVVYRRTYHELLESFAAGSATRSRAGAAVGR